MREITGAVVCPHSFAIRLGDQLEEVPVRRAELRVCLIESREKCVCGLVASFHRGIAPIRGRSGLSAEHPPYRTYVRLSSGSDWWVGSI